MHVWCGQDDGSLVRPIGNASIILVRVPRLILVDCGSKSDCIKRLQRSQTMRAIPHYRQTFAVLGAQYLDTRGMTALHVLDGQPVVCQIAQINYQENYDVAVCLIRIEPRSGTTGACRGKAALDFATHQARERQCCRETPQPVPMSKSYVRAWAGASGAFRFVARISHRTKDLWGNRLTFETTIPGEQGCVAHAILAKSSLTGKPDRLWGGIRRLMIPGGFNKLSFAGVAQTASSL